MRCGIFEFNGLNLFILRDGLLDILGLDGLLTWMVFFLDNPFLFIRLNEGFDFNSLPFLTTNLVDDNDLFIVLVPIGFL